MRAHAIAPFIAGCLVLAQPLGAQGADIKVNGKTIPEQRVELFVRNLVAQGREDTPELRKIVRDELVNRELLAQEATRRGLAKNQDVSTQIEITRQDILAGALMREVTRGQSVSDDAVRKEYERLKEKLGGREYRARHILVENENEAREIIAQIKQGAAFEKLASEKSKDPGSKARGGELGWSPAGQYVKPFGDALARLKKGQMTESPVRTPFGWHVIRVDDERAAQVPSFEQVKPSLQQRMQQQLQRDAYEKTVGDLRAKAKITE